MKKVLFLFLISLFTLSCENPSGTDPKSKSSSETVVKTETEIAIEEIKKTGMNVSFERDLKFFYFPVPGKIYYFGNTGVEKVNFFEFASEKEQLEISESMSGQGFNIGTLEPLTWVSDPHFFRKGKLIVKYIGKDLSIIAVLDKVIGKQFSGTPYTLPDKDTK